MGEVEDGEGCKTCGAGTYADQANQVCGVCDFNEYSVGSVNECTACGDGLGTLEQQSTSDADCQGTEIFHYLSYVFGTFEFNTINYYVFFEQNLIHISL